MKKENDLRGYAYELLAGFYRARASSRPIVKPRSFRSRLRERLRGREEGQAIVEFAFMVPILLMLMTGIMFVSFAIWNYQSLNQGVDAAARMLADEGKTSNSTGLTVTDPCQAAFGQITNLSTGLNPNQISATYILAVGTANQQSFGPFNGAASSCNGDYALLGQGEVTVSATYPCNIFGFRITRIFAGCQLGVTKTELSY